MDQPHDPFERRVGDRPGHADEGTAPAVDRAREDGAADALRDRLALAGQRCLVGPGLTIEDLAIDREPLARPDPDQVTDAQRLDPDASLDTVADQVSLLRTELDQCIDRPGGPVHRIRFQRVAQREQEQQNRSLAPVAQHRRSARRQDHQQVDRQPEPCQLANCGDGRQRPTGEVREEIERDREVTRRMPDTPTGDPEAGAQGCRDR